MAQIGLSRSDGGAVQGERLKEFLYERRKMLLGILSVVTFFVAWEGLYEFIELDTLHMSKPSMIYAGLLAMIESGELVREVAFSAAPFFIGLLSAAAVGILVGMLMGWRTRVGYALDPLMTALYATPLVAVVPLLIIAVGVGVIGSSIVVFILCVFPFMFNAYAGVKSVDPLLVSVVRSLGGKEWALYTKVIVPSVLPYLVAGTRYAIGRALVGIIVAEFFAASAGIGHLIATYNSMFEPSRMFVCILTMMIIAVALTQGVRWAEHAAFPWRESE